MQGIPSTTGSGLYPCPEEGCTKSYQRFFSPQNHLDCGKHVRSLEKESMLDKAVRGYAARLEGQFAGVLRMMMTAKDASGNRMFSSTECLPVQQITSFFRVWLLSEVWQVNHYGIATEDITSRRKVPYIERLEGFLKQCDCCRT